MRVLGIFLNSQMRFSVRLFTNQNHRAWSPVSCHQLWAESVASLSPVVVHVFPFPWRPGGQGPQTKPAETWTLSKHWTPGWHGRLEHGDGPVGLGLSETCGTLAGVVAASLTGESWLPWKQKERWRYCQHYYQKKTFFDSLWCRRLTCTVSPVTTVSWRTDSTDEGAQRVVTADSMETRPRDALVYIFSTRTAWKHMKY